MVYLRWRTSDATRPPLTSSLSAFALPLRRIFSSREGAVVPGNAYAAYVTKHEVWD